MRLRWLLTTVILYVLPDFHSFLLVDNPGTTSGTNTAETDLPFRNVSLPWAERVDDLVARLTLEELQEQFSRGGGGTDGGPAPAIPRLGIGAFQWWSNCGRSDANAPGNATAFPQTIGLAAAFSPDLRFRVARASSMELRAKHNAFLRDGNLGVQTGLACLSPNIDLVRDPRWGRNQETASEDPYMNGVHAQSFVRGIHGDHPRYVRATSMCKNFGAFGGPENIPVNKNSFDAQVSMRDLRMSFLPQFKMCVEAGSFGIYTATTELNGVPTVDSKFLLTDVLRGEWHYTGYVISDYGAIEISMNSFHYTNNSVDAAAAAFNAGCNLEFPGFNNPHPVYMSLVEAVRQGKIQETFFREQAKALFYTRMRLGEFDPPEMNPYTQLDPDTVVESADHQALAVEAAMKSFVLLKNDGVLPFTQLYQTIGVVGPMANATDQLFGDYAARTDRSYVTSPLDGLQAVASRVQFASGCDNNTCQHYDAQAVRAAVTRTQVNFVLLGTGQSIVSEGRDKDSMELPGEQKQLLLDTLSAAPNTPLVLVLYAASAVNITEFADDARVSAIVQGFFPAQAAGIALGHLVLNDVPGASPAGRLPYTWPALASQIPPMVNYSMEGRTYRFFQGDPLYPFGYGLSYVTFTYLNVTCHDLALPAGHNLSCVVTVHNNGHMDADEAVQAYISWTDGSLPAPKIQLAWFERVTIRSQATVRIPFTVDARRMALWFDNGWEIKAGGMVLYVGGQQPNQKRQAPSNVLTSPFTVLDSKLLGTA